MLEQGPSLYRMTHFSPDFQFCLLKSVNMPRLASTLCFKSKVFILVGEMESEHVHIQETSSSHFSSGMLHHCVLCHMEETKANRPWR